MSSRETAVQTEGRGQWMLYVEITDVTYNKKLVGVIGIVYMRSLLCVLSSLIINSYQSNFNFNLYFLNEDIERRPAAWRRLWSGQVSLLSHQPEAPRVFVQTGLELVSLRCEFVSNISTGPSWWCWMLYKLPRCCSSLFYLYLNHKSPRSKHTSAGLAGLLPDNDRQRLRVSTILSHWV